MRKFVVLIFSFILFLGSTVDAGLFGPYKWSDSKGNWVRAVKGTVNGERPEKKEIPLEKIKRQFWGKDGMGFSDKPDKEYVRKNLSRSEQEDFFKAIQKALSDTGKAEFKLSYPGSYKCSIGVPKGFYPTIYQLR